MRVLLLINRAGRSSRFEAKLRQIGKTHRTVAFCIRTEVNRPVLLSGI